MKSGTERGKRAGEVSFALSGFFSSAGVRRTPLFDLIKKGKSILLSKPAIKSFSSSSLCLITRTLNARGLSVSILYKWSLRRCSRAAGNEDDAALPLLAAENSVLKKGSLSGSTARHEGAFALVEGLELSIVMAGRRGIELLESVEGERGR